MSDIPLSLSIAHFTPYTLVHNTIDEHEPHPLPVLPAGENTRANVPGPAIPSTFAFSPTHSYVPDPFPSMSLGSTVRLGLRLANITSTANDAEGGDVRGVRMMCEIQGPSGRYRLGEAVHSDQEQGTEGEPVEKEVARSEASSEEDPAEGASAEEKPKSARPSIDEMAYADMPRLPPGGTVKLDVHNEMKELGLQVLIVSVAWETEQGRRTFQRFYKFHVNAPLAIKTRIHTSSAPNKALDPVQRTDVYLEVLMQNTSPEVMAFTNISLEPVYALSCVDVTSMPSVPGVPPSTATTADTSNVLPLYPNDTRQHLFLLRYTPPEATQGVRSVFAPFFPGGTILPLGRLDVAWVAGKYAEPGRLQTSTLNRRTAVTPIAPAPSAPDAAGPKPVPSRTTSAVGPVHGPTPATAGPSTPAKVPYPTRARTPTSGFAAPGSEGQGGEEDEWEYDLAIMENSHQDGLTEEEEMTVKLRVAVRSLKICKEGEGENGKPPPVVLGVQYLSSPPAPPTKVAPAQSAPGHAAAPSIAFSPPSPSATPVASAGTPTSARPFSPSTRPSTPLSAKLRQATAAGLTPSRALTPTPAISRATSGVSETAVGAGGLLPPATIDIDVSTTPLTSPAPSFPPAPILSSSNTAQAKLPAQGPAANQKPGELFYLGNSLIQTRPLQFVQAQEQYHTSYAESAEPPLRWEAVAEVGVRFVAVREGLADLGGLRLLDMGRSRVGREWESLGQVWVKPW